MKYFCIASIFRFCKGRILACSTNVEKNEDKNSKNDQKFKISAILDQPYFNSTKVNPQMKYEKFLYSIYMLLLQEQKFGLFHHLEKNEAQNKKMTGIYNIGHIRSAIFEYNKGQS